MYIDPYQFRYIFRELEFVSILRMYIDPEFLVGEGNGSVWPEGRRTKRKMERG